jgi:hypothetical protein
LIREVDFDSGSVNGLPLLNQPERLKGGHSLYSKLVWFVKSVAQLFLLGQIISSKSLSGSLGKGAVGKV